MKAERVVIDTNVLISALLQPSGRTAAVLEAIRDANGMLLFADETFDELATRLMRPKFDRYVEVATRQRFIADVAAVAAWVTITDTVRASRDPADDKFVEVAVNGAADCIVSGDGDLLDLDPFGDLRILAPRAFLEQLGFPPQSQSDRA
ncbi:MAG: putative toxin-antitoxin system toxin component, PIN family [Geminicoccaceae bacterium]|nr:MAG: putative toxin-antitoxin system toxin component, PIN family [Geminicoccaceae bacterium]